MTKRRKGLLLSEAACGEYILCGIAHSSEASHVSPEQADFLRRAELFGFICGEKIEVLMKRRNAIVVRTAFGRFAVGNALADLINVRKRGDDHSSTE